jgi:hypothetical protein
MVEIADTASNSTAIVVMTASFWDTIVMWIISTNLSELGEI